MGTAGLPLFSDAALAVLDGMPFNPAARGSYEVLSGGLMWPDEFPKPELQEWDAIAPNYVYRYLLAYRASITLGEERAEFRPVWEQVVRRAPNWPGLRTDRRNDRARRRLLAAKRRQAVCLVELDEYLSETSAHMAGGQTFPAPSKPSTPSP